MALNSSFLLSKLETTNWRFSMNVVLSGVPSTLLAKYVVVNEDSYALMVCDLAACYFECLFGSQIDKNYFKYHKIKLTHEEIMSRISSMLQDLPKNINTVEKIQIDCHTTRITMRCSKLFNQNFTWNFHIISTDQDVFLKHFSMPMFRGLLYFYNRCNRLHQQQQQPQQQSSPAEANDNNTNNIRPDPARSVMSTISVTDDILKHIFRYE